MPRKKLDSVRVHLLVPKTLYKEVQRKSNKTGYSISELMRRALSEFLEEKDADG